MFLEALPVHASVLLINFFILTPPLGCDIKDFEHLHTGQLALEIYLPGPVSDLPGIFGLLAQTTFLKMHISTYKLHFRGQKMSLKQGLWKSISGFVHVLKSSWICQIAPEFLESYWMNIGANVQPLMLLYWIHTRWLSWAGVTCTFKLFNVWHHLKVRNVRSGAFNCLTENFCHCPR